MPRMPRLTRDDVRLVGQVQFIERAKGAVKSWVGIPTPRADERVQAILDDVATEFNKTFPSG